MIALVAAPLALLMLALVLASVRALIAAGRTRYAVTDRRVMIGQLRGSGVEVGSLSPTVLTALILVRREHRGG